jgi:hypothetical protein
MLEDELREMFAMRADPVPATEDPAGRAIRRGRRIRRRRAAAASVSAAAALVLIAGGAVSLGTWQMGDDRRRATAVAPFDVTAEPTDLTGPTAPPVVASIHPRGSGIDLDLRSGNQLWAASGQRLALAGVDEVTRIYRVPRGWVYGSAGEVRLLRRDGTSTTLIGTGEPWIVSPDGGRVATVIGGTLHAGRIDDSGLVMHKRVTVPPGTKPIVFADERIVIAMPSSGYDLLDPARPTVPVGNRDVLAVFGRHGSGLAGLIRPAGSEHPCLAILKSARGLPVSRAGMCAVELTDATQAWLSPNGAWLATADDTGISIVDVARATTGHPPITRCAVRPSVAPTWAGSTIVTADERGLVRCRTNGYQDVVPLPAGIGPDWQLVPAVAGQPAAAPTTTRARGTAAA